MNKSLKGCPFCGRTPKVLHRTDSLDGYFCAISCFCGGCSARAHQAATGADESEAYMKAALRWNRRPEPENKPLTLHFGDGKIGVSTCRAEDSEIWNELLLWNPHMQQAIGNQIPIAEGTTTDDVEVYARLFFHNPESAQVVADALNRIVDSCGGNKPLTLEELRERAGKPVWISGINRWGVVGKRTDCRMAIGFVYGWEWLDDVLRGRYAYDRPPGEASND